MLNLSYPSLPGEGLGDQALEPGVYVCVCVCVCVCVEQGWGVGSGGRKEAKVRLKGFPLNRLAWGL